MSKKYMLEMPEELHAEIKAAAALSKGKKMSDLMIETLAARFGGTVTIQERGGKEEA
jgi:predicted HicB family RNase H-like nuclease